jgi:hypothetical protein
MRSAASRLRRRPASSPPRRHLSSRQKRNPITCDHGRNIRMICKERYYLAPDDLRSRLAGGLKNQICEHRIPSIEISKTNSQFLAPAFESPDHREHRPSIGLTHPPGVVGQECQSSRGFADRGLDWPEIMVSHTRCIRHRPPDIGRINQGPVLQPRASAGTNP